MRRSQQRLVAIGVAGVVLAAAVGLALYGARGAITYFYTPSEIAQKAEAGQRVRIGGLVETGSIVRETGSGAVAFRVTDGGTAIPVRYEGIPPDLFGDNQGVVAEGVWQDAAVFEADRILARHDENYMPKEVVDSLKARGEWKGDGDPSR